MMEQDVVLARIGTTLTVTQSEVDDMIAAVSRRGQNYNTPEGRKAVLEQLIAQKLMLCDAQRNLFEREPAFKAELQKAKEELLVNYAISKVVSAVRVTDAEVRKYYEDHESELQGEETVNASHILVDDEALAKDLLAKINAGELTFEDAARRYSSCPSKEDGGNLGDFGKGQMVPEFDEACFSMEEGELRGPVRTQFGYHLIRLNKKNPPVKPTYEELRDRLREQVLSEKQQAAYRSKINQLRILYPVERV